jgi:hypothetical protein
MTTQKKVLKALAEAYNLLQQAKIDGLKGSQLRQAGQIIADFDEVVAALASGALQVTEQEVGNATE